MGSRSSPHVIVEYGARRRMCTRLEDHQIIRMGRRRHYSSRKRCVHTPPASLTPDHPGGIIGYAKRHSTTDLYHLKIRSSVSDRSQSAAAALPELLRPTDVYAHQQRSSGQDYWICKRAHDGCIPPRDDIIRSGWLLERGGSTRTPAPDVYAPYQIIRAGLDTPPGGCCDYRDAPYAPDITSGRDMIHMIIQVNPGGGCTPPEDHHPDGMTPRGASLPPKPQLMCARMQQQIIRVAGLDTTRG